MSKGKAKYDQELQQFVTGKEWKKALTSCEEWELEAAQDGGVPNYGVQLILYYLNNDAVNARFLWKRIPSSAKSGKPELGAIWKIGQGLWQKNYPEIYKAINSFQWTEPHRTLILAFLEQFRSNTFQLLSRSYQTISVSDAAVYLGLDNSQIVPLATQHGWSFDSTSNMLLPKFIPPSKDQSTGLVQLQQLTDYFCFLEN